MGRKERKMRKGTNRKDDEFEKQGKEGRQQEGEETRLIFKISL